MADNEGTLKLSDLTPQNLNTEYFLGKLVEQLEKDLQFEITTKLPHELLNQVCQGLKNYSLSGELMPALYRIDLNEDIATEHIGKENWQALALAVIKRSAIKIALRYAVKD